MTFTLHRYIFRELFKVFALSSLALTLMMSLGGVLQPIQEYGVGPSQVFRLMLYFLPITLTFVLPIAALFSASLVYGRFASDNELDACRASGISLTTLIYPGLVLAMIVAIANLLLSFYVMPEFVHRAESAIKSDAQQIIFRNIQRQGYYEPPQGDYLIRADYADLDSQTLGGVIITEREQGGIGRIITAQTAKVTFNKHARFNEVRIIARDTMQLGYSGGRFSMERLSISKEFGSLMTDSIKFKKINQIKKIRDINPMHFYPIEKTARQAAAQYTAELLAQDIAAKVIEGGRDFYRLARPDGQITFTADNITSTSNKSVRLQGNVIVTDSTRDRERTYNCSLAILHIEGDEFAPTITMEMRNATWSQPDGTEVLDRRPIIYGLLLPQSVSEEFESQRVMENLEIDTVKASLNSGPLSGPTDHLKKLISRLKEKISDTLVTIQAEIHSRLVFGVGCIPMILIGIGLGIIKKEGHLLSAFGASVIPALVLVICIMSGKQLTKNPAAGPFYGVLIMWAGVVGLFILTLIIYRKLLRN